MNKRIKKKKGLYICKCRECKQMRAKIWYYLNVESPLWLVEPKWACGILKLEEIPKKSKRTLGNSLFKYIFNKLTKFDLLN